MVMMMYKEKRTIIQLKLLGAISSDKQVNLRASVATTAQLSMETRIHVHLTFLKPIVKSCRPFRESSATRPAGLRDPSGERA
jgi:hypothetical protein